MARKAAAEIFINNAKVDFKHALSGLKDNTDWSDEEIAQRIGCTAQTISNMRKDPFGASGKYILLIQRYFFETERDRNRKETA